MWGGLDDYVIDGVLFYCVVDGFVVGVVCLDVDVFVVVGFVFGWN